MAEEGPRFLRPTNFESEASRPFWAGLAEGRLLAQRCGACGERFFPPRPRCPRCLGEDLEWSDLSGRGTLHSWTEVHLSSPALETPFLLGLVDLEGGIGRLAAKVTGATVEDLEIGMPVRVGFAANADDGAIYTLSPDREGSPGTPGSEA